MDKETVGEIKRHFDATADRMNRHFGVVVEGLESKMEALAEGQQAGFDRVDRQLAEMRTELRHELDETRAMVHLSYVEVDRRLRDLESGRSV